MRTSTGAPCPPILLHLQHAFIAVEDHRFYAHPGVDPTRWPGVFRTSKPGTPEGGSTLTQQLARTLFLSNQKSYGRKIREAALAVLIDAQLTKDQVLELYLNRIYLSAGVYGVETMSRHLFGRPAKQLNLAECALIAGLARAPSTLSPWSNLDGALARSHVVLARMRDEKFITESDEREALRTSIRIQPYPRSREPGAGYAKEFLRQSFREGFGGDHPPDWEVRTTFVPALQDAAEQRDSLGLARFNAGDLSALVAVRRARAHPGDGRRPRLRAIPVQSRGAEPAARDRRSLPLPFAAALEHSATLRCRLSKVWRAFSRRVLMNGRRAMPTARPRTR